MRSFIEQFRWRTYVTRKQGEIHFQAEAESSGHRRRVIKSAALAAKKLSAAHGQPSTNQIRVAARRAGEVAGKSGANRARAKVREKAAENESLIVANDIASAAMNY
jgi:hypothetical protein